MSREILFRGRTKKRKWVKGDLFHGRCFVAINDRELELIPPQMIEVDPDTVCQYTGLKDENNVKIFEGDIAVIDDEADRLFRLFTVCWNDDSAKFELAGSYCTIEFDDLWSDQCQCSVIGNVYDNPELLEETTAQSTAQYADQDGLMPAT